MSKLYFLKDSLQLIALTFRSLTTYIIIIGIQPLGRSGQRPKFSQATGVGSGTLHPGQVLRGSLPLLSPAF